LKQSDFAVGHFLRHDAMSVNSGDLLGRSRSGLLQNRSHIEVWEAPKQDRLL
jgi:hypothetical protein